LKSTRLEDQRTSLLPSQIDGDVQIRKDVTVSQPKSQQGVTLVAHDEDFFTLIQRMQSRRLDEQRSEIPKALATPYMNPKKTSKSSSIV
jgi:hypothetical protein